MSCFTIFYLLEYRTIILKLASNHDFLKLSAQMVFLTFPEG